MNPKLLLLNVLLLLSFQSFSTGAYIEFSIKGEENVAVGTMKGYYQDGNARTEMRMSMPQMPGGEMAFISIVQKANPTKAYILDEKKKTYTESDFGKNSTSRSDSAKYEVTVLGAEKVNGYASTHVKVKINNSKSEQEFWLSTDIKDFEAYQGMDNKYTSTGLYKALKAKGVNGYPVRIKTSEQGHGMQMDLVKIEQKTNSAALFSLDGYTKSESSGMPPNMQEMKEKLQNMTPEERQKFMQEMQQQYQQKPH